MNKTILTLALLATLGACNKEDHTIVAGGAPADDYNATADANVVLPPAIKASKTYRCDGNTIVRVDWLEGDKAATVTPDKGSPIAVNAAEAGKPMTAADGTSVTGSSTSGSVRIALAGKPALTCKA